MLVPFAMLAALEFIPKQSQIFSPFSGNFIHNLKVISLCSIFHFLKWVSVLGASQTWAGDAETVLRLVSLALGCTGRCQRCHQGALNHVYQISGDATSEPNPLTFVPAAFGQFRDHLWARHPPFLCSSSFRRVRQNPTRLAKKPLSGGMVLRINVRVFQAIPLPTTFSVETKQFHVM